MSPASAGWSGTGGICKTALQFDGCGGEKEGPPGVMVKEVEKHPEAHQRKEEA